MQTGMSTLKGKALSFVLDDFRMALGYPTESIQKRCLDLSMSYNVSHPYVMVIESTDVDDFT